MGKLTGLGYALVVAAACLWGSMGVLSKSLFLAGLEPLAVSSVRAAIAFLATFICVAVWRPRYLYIDKQDAVFFVTFGFFGVAVFYWLMLWSINQTSVATAVILLYTAPIYITLYGWLRLGEELNRTKIISLCCTLLGSYLAIGGYNWTNLKLNGWGIVIGIGSALTYAAFNIMGKQGTKKYPPLTVALYSLGFGALFLTLVRPPWQLFLHGYERGIAYKLLILGVFMTFVPYVFYTIALNYLEASKASITATLEPVVGILLAFMVLGERLEAGQVIGICLVLGGIVLLQLAEHTAPA
jgi:drug/metabolite transporter, DME family